jgi:nucleotide-binding universal stress UspA family protein
MIDIRRILCPVDFSDSSQHALKYAVTMANWYDAKVTLFHACVPVPISAYATVASMMAGDARRRGRTTTRSATP